MNIKSSFVSVCAACLLCACHGAKSEGSATAPKADETKQADKDVPVLTVPAVASLLKEKAAVVLDANDDDTRKQYGVIPGAVLLSSHRDYPLSELPASKSEPLVFYCGGVKCRASDAAASRALSAGYEHVSVMREGIRGWKDAGQPTATPQT